MSNIHPARHLLRAKDLADGRYFEPLSVAALATAAGLSPDHFSREFRRAFGESPHRYLLTRRLERAAALLRNTDRTVADICLMVGFVSVGSFTTSFRRTFGLSPTAYRSACPPAAARARIPDCLLRAWGRPHQETAGLEKSMTAGPPTPSSRTVAWR
jgi:AraC-like DNA-binding protein